MAEKVARGIVDTSVVIDLERIEPAELPAEIAISAVFLAELAAGPHATRNGSERARRQDRLQRTEAAFDPIPFDAAAARAFGRIYEAVAAAGRKPRAVAPRTCSSRRRRWRPASLSSPATRTTSPDWRTSSRSSRSPSPQPDQPRPLTRW